MNTKEIVKELASRKGITIAELERNLGIANGTVGKWDKQNPTTEPLSKLSDYFDVSIDYLLGKTDNPYRIKTAEEDFSHLIEDKEEADLLAAFRLESEDMSETEKKKFNKSLKGMMKIAKGLLDDDTNWKD